MSKESLAFKVDVTCDSCGKSFQKRRSQYVKTAHHFCSRSCFGKWLSKTKRGKTKRGKKPSFRSPIEQTCKHCSKTFLARPVDIEKGWAQFCSRECRITARQVECVCKNCGKTFKATKSKVKNNRGQFCNRKCKGDWQRENVFGPSHHLWKGGYGNAHYGPDWQSQRRKVRKRAKYCCEHCGISEKKLKRQLDVHHIRPFIEFSGDYETANHLSNLIALCKSCHILVEHGKIAVQPHLEYLLWLLNSRPR